MPAVSVILPNYNHGIFLERRILSILNQTFQDFELIILDDCSPDNSREIIQRYENHPKVSHVIFNEVNSGNTFVQWQRGLELAKGELIWIAESDDYCELIFLENLIVPMQKNSQVNIAFCQAIYIDHEDRIVGHTVAERLEELIDGRQFISKYMLGLNGIHNVSLAVFRREAWQQVNPVYRSMKYCGDWYFWMDMAARASVYISGRYLSYFTRHTGNVSTGAERNGLFFLEGNSFFGEFVQKSSADRASVAAALQQKLARFHEIKAQMSVATRQQVLDSIFALDPEAKKIFSKNKFRSVAGSLIPPVLKRVLPF